MRGFPDLIKSGVKALNERNYEEAEKLVSLAVSIEPRNPVALYLLGVSKSDFTSKPIDRITLPLSN